MFAGARSKPKSVVIATSAMERLGSRRASYTERSMVVVSMPRQTAQPPWGSMSTSKVLWPLPAMQAARMTAVVVLATPPFWLATAMTLGMWDEGTWVLLALEAWVAEQVERCSDGREGVKIY